MLRFMYAIQVENKFIFCVVRFQWPIGLEYITIFYSFLGLFVWCLLFREGLVQKLFIYKLKSKFVNEFNMLNN